MTNQRTALIVLGFAIFILAAYFAIDNFYYTETKPIDTLAAAIPNLKAAVPFEIKNLNGEIIRPENFKGKILILNFWASWCGPCVHEFPSLLQLVKTYKNDVVLIAISGDDSEEAITSFLKNYDLSGLPISIAWDKDRSIANLYGTRKLPESYIFARENRLYKKIEGSKNWMAPAFLSAFENLIKN